MTTWNQWNWFSNYSYWHCRWLCEREVDEFALRWNKQFRIVQFLQARQIQARKIELKIYHRDLTRKNWCPLNFEYHSMESIPDVCTISILSFPVFSRCSSVIWWSKCSMNSCAWSTNLLQYNRRKETGLNACVCLLILGIIRSPGIFRYNLDVPLIIPARRGFE